MILKKQLICPQYTVLEQARGNSYRHSTSRNRDVENKMKGWAKAAWKPSPANPSCKVSKPGTYPVILGSALWVRCQKKATLKGNASRKTSSPGRRRGSGAALPGTQSTPPGLPAAQCGECAPPPPHQRGSSLNIRSVLPALWILPLPMPVLLGWHQDSA